MAEKNLDGSGLNEVWVRAAQLVKKYTGAVDLTKGNLQTQVDTKITGTDDTKDNVITFTSSDELNPSAWKDVAVLASNENHKSILNKISTMFNNVRYLYKILGSTDISALGTVTQAIATIKGNIGDMKGISSSAAITTQGQYALDAREKNASVDGTLANEINKLNSNLNFYRHGESDIDDFDNAPYGFSYASTSTANRPDDASTQRFLIFTFTNSNGYYKRQFAISEFEAIYSRDYDKAWNTWRQWTQIN